MTTRMRILDTLAKQHPASAGELSRALGSTAANIRHHLAALLAEGVVLVSAERPPAGRGRPTLLYELASQAERHNLDKLAGALLDMLLEGLPPSEQDAALARLAHALPGGQAAQPGAHLTRRLVRAVQQLNAMGYQARWEAHKQAPRLYFEHCPYAAILPQHPELCRLDEMLIEGALDSPARLERKLASDARGRKYCLFLLTAARQTAASE